MRKIVSELESSIKLEIVLNEIPKSTIVAYLLKKASNDKRFENELLSAFSKPDRERENAVIKEFIKTTVRQNTSRGYIDYRGCDNICYEYDQVLTREEERLSLDYCLIVFDTALQILSSCVKLASTADSSSGSLTATINHSLELIEKACSLILEQSDDNENKKTYEMLLKQALSKSFDAWEEWSYELLKYSTVFLTEKNKIKLYDTLDKLSQRLSLKDTFGYSTYTAADKLVRFYAIQKLEGADAANAYMLQNIDIDVFRKMAINTALKKSDFDYAEKLCLEKLDGVKHGQYCKPSEWLYLLCTVYETSGNTEKRAETVRKILFAGDTSYYDVLKSIYQKNNVWEAEYPSILNSVMKLSPPNCMSILKKEKEWQLLFETVKTYSSTVFDYGKDLATYYPKEIFMIYTSEIEKAAKEATDRRKYYNVCSLIKKLYEAGGTVLAADIIDRFAEEYKRRPAMVEELMKLKRKFEKAIS